MQSIGSPAADPFSDVLSRLPAGLDLDRLALEHGAMKRRRAVRGGEALLRLALMRGPGGRSLRETAALAGLQGLAEISNPGLKYRLDGAADFLDAIVGRLLAGRAPGETARCPGRCLRVADTSCVSGPGRHGRLWRVHGVFDLGRGGFSHLAVSDRHGADSLERGAPVAGEVRIADRNYAKPTALYRFLQQGGGAADVIVRVGWNAFALRNPDGARFDLAQYLADLPAGFAPHEVALRARVGHKPVLPLRLVIQRKPEAAAQAARTALHRAAQRMQKQLDPRSLLAAEFIVLATSLPAESCPAAEVLALYRLRWQIELAFKRMKSLLHMDQMPTRTDAAGRSWLLAHLIFALLNDDLSQQVIDSFP